MSQSQLDGQHPALKALDWSHSLAKLHERLREHEGERLRVYDDANGKPVVKGYTLKGHPTIGVGRNLAGRGITKDEAADLLENDVDDCIDEVLDAFPWANDMDNARFSVLVELCFNMGLPVLKTFTNTLRAMATKDYVAAARGMLASKWASDVGPKRSGRLAQVMQTGEWL
jgi:lysozyme